MPLRGIAFSVIYFFCLIGALFAPHLGVFGYLITYCIGPENEWWAMPLRRMGIRFSFLMTAATAVGFIIKAKGSKREERAWQQQETWFWVFIALMWLSDYIAAGTALKYGGIDAPTVKMLKVGIFLLLYTRLMSDKKRLDGLLWTFVFCSLILGLQSWEVPWSAFQAGRLEHIGGADFAEANFFAAFMGAMLPLIGAKFLKSNWRGKAFCIIAAAFTCNAVILCRSRGAFLGLAIGLLAAAAYSPKKHRLKIYFILLVGILGAIRLTDRAFIERTLTVARPLEGAQLDSSAESRPRLWMAGYEIMMDHPLGVGPGRWFDVIGNYIPEYAGKDAHSTYGRAMGELGLPGALVFLIVIFYAFKNLRMTRQIIIGLASKDAEQFEYLVFGSKISLIVILISGLFITMTYTEAFWLLLMLPTCILKAARSELASKTALTEQEDLA